ncbi:hypothetical protein D3C78_1064940 [compost metagenome]
MKTASAGKLEKRDADLAAGGLDAALGILDIGGVENHERPAFGRDGCRGGEPAGQPAVGKFAILRTVILEGPAEGAAVKFLAALDIGDVEFDIVDPPVVCIRGHRSSISPFRAAPSAFRDRP